MKKLILLTTFLVLLIAIVYKVNGGFNFVPEATAQTVGDIVVDWGVPAGKPIFYVLNFMPGDVETRTVKIKNISTSQRIIGIQGIKTSLLSYLGTALEITISENGNDLYGGTRGTKIMSQFFFESALFNSIRLFTLNPNETKTVTFKVKFKNNAGNLYQKTKLVFNLKLGYYLTSIRGCEGIKYSGPFMSPFSSKCFFTK